MASMRKGHRKKASQKGIALNIQTREMTERRGSGNSRGECQQL